MTINAANDIQPKTAAPNTSPNAPDAAIEKAVTEHDTLKYHLLGPSLTKAGQDSVDQSKVSEIIYNASKGSKYFNNEEHKDKTLTSKIERILAKKRQLERLDLASDLRRADEYIAELELTRDLSQTVVHIDCDAFYAAVEELDRPELKHVPMAVGKGVLTTCNYHARKFGCRSGMAGFVAMKLCPSLICLPLNFEKYTAKAQEVREILAEYDPRFESASIDEAYLNITEYCREAEMDPWDAVMQLRTEVEEKTHVTISAGLAPNAKIAKIASNRNKPNGQFRLSNDRPTIISFMRDLPTRKVNGIGRVFERELDAIGIKTCGEIYAQRQYLSKLFGEKAFQFLMQTYLGLGRTNVQPAEEHERKSVGTESTFHEMNDPQELREKLRCIAEELEKDLTRTQFKGRTLVLKIKLHTYEVFTRQVIPPKAVATADDLYTYGLPMFSKLEKEISGMRLRLMGLRCTHLISTKKNNHDFFGLRRFSSVDSDPSNPNGAHTSKGIATTRDESGEWEVWPETEFEAAAAAERRNDFLEIERLSQEQESHPDHEGPDSSQPVTQEEALEESNRRHKHGREILPNPTPPRMRMDSGIGFRHHDLPNPVLQRKREEKEAEEERRKREERPWICPICQRPQEAEERAFNEHVDFCLSRGVIKETAAINDDRVDTAGDDSNEHRNRTTFPLSGSLSNSAQQQQRRGRPSGKRKAGLEVAAGKNKKLFFGKACV